MTYMWTKSLKEYGVTLHILESDKKSSCFGLLEEMSQFSGAMLNCVGLEHDNCSATDPIWGLMIHHGVDVDNTGSCGHILQILSGGGRWISDQSAATLTWLQCESHSDTTWRTGNVTGDSEKVTQVGREGWWAQVFPPPPPSVYYRGPYQPQFPSKWYLAMVGTRHL